MVRTYKGDATTGFQSPAEGYIEPVIDLAEIIDLRRPTRYPVRVVGDALEERGIFHGDILVAEAWGIGRGSIDKLKRLGAESIADFVALPAETVRQTMTVTGLRTTPSCAGFPACRSHWSRAIASRWP